MGRAEQLEKEYYRSRARTTDRFKKGIQPFYYYYLTWRNQPFYTEEYVMDSSNSNCNWMIREQLEYIRHNVDSFRVVITGPEGSGKTMLELAVAHLVRDWDAKGGQVHLGWGPVGFCQLFEDGLVHDNDVVVPDEMKIHYEGEDSKKILWRTENIMTTNRKRRIHYIIGSKEIRKFFPVLAEFKICGKDKERRETQFLLKLGSKLIGKGHIPIRDLEGYTKMEEQYKDEFIKMIETRGGAVTVHGDKKEAIEARKEINYQAEDVRDFILLNVKDAQLHTFFSKWFEGENQIDIADELGVSQPCLSKKKRNFGNKHYGRLLEEYFRKQFNDPRIGKIVGRAPQGVADLITESEKVGSVKGRITTRPNVAVKLFDKEDGCLPEIDEAKRRGQNTITVLFANPLWYKGYDMVEVDFTKKTQVLFYSDKTHVVV